MNLHVYHIVYTLRAFASKVVLYDFQSVAVVDKTALLLSALAVSLGTGASGCFKLQEGGKRRGGETFVKLCTMKHGLSWQTASLLHLIGSEGKRIVKIANTK
jgi:hypothetical protein